MGIPGIGGQAPIPARSVSAPPRRLLTEAVLLTLLTPEEGEAFLEARAANAAEDREERSARAAENAIRRAEPDARAATRTRSYTEGFRCRGSRSLHAAILGLPSSRSGHQRQVRQFHPMALPSGAQ